MNSVGRTKELDLALNQFYKVMYVDFGIREYDDKIKNWYMLSWDEFFTELKKFIGQYNNKSLIEDWKIFFHNHKTRILELMK